VKNKTAMHFLTVIFLFHAIIHQHIHKQAAIRTMN